MTSFGRITVAALALISVVPSLPAGRAEASRQLHETHPPPASAGPHTPIIVVRNGP